MKTIFKQSTILFLSLGILITSLGGCTTSRNARNLARGNIQQGRNIAGKNLQGTLPNTGLNRNDLLGANRVTPSPNAQLMSSNDKTRADNIKRQLGNMRELRNVNVLVNGNNALVGYNATDAKTDINILKNTITTKIKQIDRSITSVTATDSPDMLVRINRLGSDIARNMGADEIAIRFKKLVNDINNSVR